MRRCDPGFHCCCRNIIRDARVSLWCWLNPSILTSLRCLNLDHIINNTKTPTRSPPPPLSPPNTTPAHNQMASKPKSRWETTDDDPAELLRLKADKEAKKKAKADKERRKAEAAAASAAAAAPSPDEPQHPDASIPPPKRRKLDEDTPTPSTSPAAPLKLLRFDAPEITPCRHVDHYELLNHIEEGSYGIVSRARDTATGEVVALKKLKLEREKDGFPITSLREISTLMTCKHPNVVNLREVVMGDRLDQ